MSSAGAVGRYLDGVGKRRPCVVVALDETIWLIAYGTTTEGRDYAFVRIGEREISGLVLRLTGPTFFYKPNIVALPIADAAKRVEVFPQRRCAAQVLIQLRALAELGGADQ